MVVPGGFRQGLSRSFRAVLRRILGCSLPVLAIAFWLAAGPVTSPAWAQQDVFVATGVPVDITGDLATLRDQAMMQAQRDAFRKILTQIAPEQAVAGLALPPDDQLTSWVQDFEIEDEKMSASRYIGRFTFRFAAEPIRQFLSENGVSFAETSSKPVLVLPIYTDETGTTELWGPTNVWMSTWTARPQQPGLVPIVAPRGGLDDSNTISATQALAGDQAGIQTLAQRYDAGDVMVAEATLSAPTADGRRTLALSVTRYGVEGTQNFKDQVEGDAANIDQLMKDGVEKVAAIVQSSWKDQNLIDPNQRQQLSVHVPVTDLSQWVAVKRRLGKVSSIKGVNLLELSRSGADIEVTYVGDEAQFIRALAQADLLLTDSGEGSATITLAPNGVQPAQPVQP
jgi:hypothetical protein